MIGCIRIYVLAVYWQLFSFSISSAFLLRQQTHHDRCKSIYASRRNPALSQTGGDIKGNQVPLSSWENKPRKGKKTAPRISPLGSKTPEDVEAHMSVALEALRSVSQKRYGQNSTFEMLLFPTVRICNAALAALGDEGDLLRALRLFGKMRKAEALSNYLQKATGTTFPVPGPSLVTYSTLMSRAVSLRKPRVALRLLKLMGPDIPLDLKASNILMNCYAKLSDINQAMKLFDDMKTGQHSPNLVTFNTLLHACQKAGDLESALHVKSDLDSSGLRADTRTYTSLIATVARKRSKLGGANDPSMAFSFLEEMQSKGIRPNGMTYSALIDACGRCGRSDLALQGLRLMLQQKTREQHAYGSNSLLYVLPNEVGAWTAAIDACGKAGRWETALRLFRQMTNNGVQPNAITCGCLTDTLLRYGRTKETLNVLRYMKEHDILPSEVMYTSLMIHAERLLEVETQEIDKLPRRRDTVVSGDELDTKAIEVYTELILSLLETDFSSNRRPKASEAVQAEDDSLLLKVFLVFQQMKDAGAKPDLACYNALLRACARAGDMDRAQMVLQRIEEDDLIPNDKSWRELLRIAMTKAQGDLALSVWKQGLMYRRRERSQSVDEPELKWRPSPASFRTLLTAYLRQIEKERDIAMRRYLCDQFVKLYEGVLLADASMGMDGFDIDALLADTYFMLAVLQGIVTADALFTDSGDRLRDLRGMATSILKLDCMADLKAIKLSKHHRAAVILANSWK